jgi:poly-gamma-glutamate synthesis protein (capsule biosynthesis protein)
MRSSSGPDTELTTPTLDPERTLRSFTLAATGDFLIHAPVQRRAAAYAGGAGYSFSPMLAEVAPIISAADLALCHMETPVSPDNTSLSGYPIFNAPRDIVTAAAGAGYDGCSAASNHSLDKGATGIGATLDVLDAAGLKHAGTARSALEAMTPTIYDVQGVKVGHLSFTYGTNGIPVPAASPWAVNVIDPAKILADAQAARAGGAEFVVVSLQWGNEYQSAPTPEQQALAAQLLASPDVDLIVGSHVHVVQPIQKVGEKYVAYGVGNFLSNQGAPSTPTASQDGMILQALVREQPDGSFRATEVGFTPTWVDRSSYVVTLATPSINAASYERTMSAVTSLGPLAYQGEPIFGPIDRSSP